MNALKKILLLIGLVIATLSFSSASEFDKIIAEEGIEYVIRLKNGDLLTGTIVSFKTDPEQGEGIRVATEIGNAVIYENQIAEISLKKEHYRHDSRIFLMPTAEPISNNHYIGSFELLFFNAGIGISDYVSIMAGRTIIPGIDGRQQASNLNAKVTFYNHDYEDFPGGMSLAAGANLAFINHDNKIANYYAVATFRGYRSRINAMVFAKSGNEDVYDVRFKDELVNFAYQNGAVGIGLGLDTKFTSWHGLHFIGEIWNNNITKPTNTAVTAGFRLSNTNFAMDFGFAFSTAPFAAPFVSFVWTPF